MDKIIQIIQNLDNSIILNIYNVFKDNQIFQNFFTFITILGNGGFIWCVFIIILLFNKKTRKYAIFIAISLIIGAIFGNIFLKNFFQRERPFLQLDLIPFINAPKSYSFPSGHSLSSFVCATSIFFINKKMGILSFILAFFIASSRVFLIVHYPSDVFFGAIFGILISIILFKILTRFSYLSIK